MKMTNTLRLCIAATALSGALTAHARLICYEGFDYPTNAPLLGQAGGYGWLGGSAWDRAGGYTMQGDAMGYAHPPGTPLATSGLICQYTNTRWQGTAHIQIGRAHV